MDGHDAVAVGLERVSDNVKAFTVVCKWFVASGGGCCEGLWGWARPTRLLVNVFVTALSDAFGNSSSNIQG